MSIKNKKLILVQRLLIWAIYLSSGFILYSRKGYLFTFLISFSKVIYPLSIFWLQIKLKRKDNLLSINNSMTTSQLWYTILPILASFLTVIFSLLNACLFLSDKLF